MTMTKYLEIWTIHHHQTTQFPKSTPSPPSSSPTSHQKTGKVVDFAKCALTASTTSSSSQMQHFYLERPSPELLGRPLKAVTFPRNSPKSACVSPFAYDALLAIEVDQCFQFWFLLQIYWFFSNFSKYYKHNSNTLNLSKQQICHIAITKNTN